MTDPTQPRLASGHESEGKPAALIAWGLYILSIPSANLLVIVGVIVAYAARASATGVARQHLDSQIALFWSVFWWSVLLWIGVIVGGILSFVLIGIPVVIVCGIGLLLIFIWFTVKSVLGLMNLLQDRPA